MTQMMTPTTQKRVLLIDDDPLITELFGEILGALYEVRTANSLAAAQQIINSEAIHAVVSDYHFGGEDADGLFAWILQTKPDLAANFILLTGDKMANLSAFETMARVLYKPIHIEVLLDTVQQVFQADKEVLHDSLET